MITPQQSLKYIDQYKGYLQFNCDLMKIYEGNLKQFILADLKAQMSEQTYAQAQFRLAPINILPKIVDKLTNIYQTTVIRNVESAPGSTSPSADDPDQEIVDWFVDKMQMNKQMNQANEFFNLPTSALIQPNMGTDGIPFLRVLQPDKYLVFSDDQVDPCRPTDVLLLYFYNGEPIVWIYNADMIIAIDMKGDIRRDIMAQYQLDGTNPIGRLPFVYVNPSKYSIVPCPDEDGLKIIKLLPLMLTDLNYAAMFQCFSIIYGINVDEQAMTMAPNAFWRFKAEASSDQKPEVGVLKPTVDYTQVLGLIESQLSMWLGTKGIRASSVGALSQDNFQSGISKIIDEMDTFEARQKQVNYFTKAESEIWDLILNDMYPYWVKSNQMKSIGNFTPGAKVKTSFAVQLPMQTRGQVVIDLATEYQNGFISRKAAIQKLNPELSEIQVEAMITEIDNEHTIIVPQQQLGANNGMATNNSGNSGQSQAAGTLTISGPGN